MRALGEWVLTHRALIFILWALVAVAGGLTTQRTVDRLSYEFALPGQPAYETNQLIHDRFGGGGSDDPLLLVARGDRSERDLERVVGQVEEAVPGLRAVTPSDPRAERLAARDGSVAVAVIYPPAVSGPDPYAAAQPRIEKVLSGDRADGVDVTLTGFNLLVDGGSSGDRSVLVEVLFGAVGALVVLALVFGSLLAGVPLLVAAVSILGTYLALLGLTFVTDVSFVVQYLVALIGLGVAIDYSLLIVTRWREERSVGAGNDDAIRRSLATAGHSVLFSGITVAVSLAALVLVPLPFLRSIGLGGLLIPLFSVATALTLVPALLSVAGPALTWPRRSARTGPSRFWGRLARGVLAHRWATIAGTSLLLVALALPVVGLTLGSPQLSGVTSDSAESRAVTVAIRAGMPVGVLRPTEVVVPEAKVAVALDRLSTVDGVAAAVAPPGGGWRRDSRALIQVWSSTDPASESGRRTLERVRAVATGDAAVGGSPAEDADFVSAVYADVVWVVLGVVLVTFLLLAKALRSLWLPVKALVLNVLSIGAAYGVTVLVWQRGLGSDLLFGQPSTGVITTWVPIAAFSFLFGLSMDYEVFILSRMRESWDEHEDTDRAVVDGIAHTGRLVTSAALILFLAFVALSTVPSVDVKILATTLALGILIDAVVVRSLLAPALVGVLGHLNWILPEWLARVVREPATTPARTAPQHTRGAE